MRLANHLQLNIPFYVNQDQRIALKLIFQLNQILIKYFFSKSINKINYIKASFYMHKLLKL